MILNFDNIKEDVRKIGVALVVAGLLADFIQETSFLSCLFQLFSAYYLLL